jgi:hypothetical protein
MNLRAVAGETGSEQLIQARMEGSARAGWRAMTSKPKFGM